MGPLELCLPGCYLNLNRPWRRKMLTTSTVLDLGYATHAPSWEPCDL